MTDYDKLVDELRKTERICRDRMDGQVMLDAADAIEALQAEQKKTVTQIFGEEQMAWEGRCKDLMKYISDLQAEVKILKVSGREAFFEGLAADAEPKRGKWVEDTTTYAGPGLSNYKCSLCGKICGTWRSGLKQSELPNWCGNCGADMRAKLEVQDD